MKLHFLLPLVVATPLLAEGSRELDAHEHGVGALNIAFDGKDIAMEFIAPGADIVGFEYEATSDNDIAAIEAALVTLSSPLELFSFPETANCSLISADAELESESHDDHDDHDDHKDEDHHDHDDHDDHKDEDHDDHADHDDHDHEGKASHTEFHAEYVVECANPENATELTFGYFDVFENAREVHVQVITGSGATAFDVERDAPALDLKDAL